MTLAIIPARGGSKRIPGKNTRAFLGKPIIAYSIEAALQSGLFDEVMVSTDDEDIKQVALAYGATVPFMRSAQNSDDFATTSAVLIEVVEAYAQLGKSVTTAACIYPTAPFVSAEKLKSAHALLLSGAYASVFPVMRFSYPIQRALRRTEAGLVNMMQPEHLNSRSQDLEPAYHDAGQFYFFQVADFLKAGAIFNDNSGAIIISEMEGHDIDNLEDWQVAEFKYGVRYGK
jgi:N-acylneuraminate cytidylyltransferase